MHNIPLLMGVIFVVGIVIGVAMTLAIVGWGKSGLSKTDAQILRALLSYVRLDLKAMWRNERPIGDDEELSKHFVSWAGADEYVEELQEDLAKWNR